MKPAPAPVPENLRIGGVRRFIEDDIPLVADLHRRVFETAEVSAPGWMHSYRSYFADVFGDFRSLVYEDRAGITGFLGLQERPMLFEGRPITMAVSSQFVVDPARRGLAGLQMIKACFDGPQDLTFTDEASDNMRRVWEWCGGTTALLYSMDWIRPLRPASAVLNVLLGRRSPRLARLSAPVAQMTDAVCGKLHLGFPRPNEPAGWRGDLNDATLAQLLPAFAENRSLRPDYSHQSVSWIVNRAATRRTNGEFRKVLVRDSRNEIAGWYLYFANRGGIGEVLHIAARKQAVGDVLDHLIDDALQSGVAALAGRFDPALAGGLADRDCVFIQRGFWTLIHSRNPKLLQAIQRGDAFLTRMEGEWCLRFH